MCVREYVRVSCRYCMTNLYPPFFLFISLSLSILPHVLLRALTARVFDGRCAICKGSTFPEDQINGSGEGDGEEKTEGKVKNKDKDKDKETLEKEKEKKKYHEVILCDGCNSEAHLRCLGLANVPQGDFYCKDCKSREETRKPIGDDMFIGNLDNHRDTKLEEVLCNKRIDKVAAADGMCTYRTCCIAHATICP